MLILFLIYRDPLPDQRLRRARLSRVVGSERLVQFLKPPPFRLHEAAADEHKLKVIEEDKEHVEAVAEARERSLRVAGEREKSLTKANFHITARMSYKVRNSLIARVSGDAPPTQVLISWMV